MRVLLANQKGSNILNEKYRDLFQAGSYKAIQISLFSGLLKNSSLN